MLKTFGECLMAYLAEELRYVTNEKRTKQTEIAHTRLQLESAEHPTAGSHNTSHPSWDVPSTDDLADDELKVGVLCGVSRYVAEHGVA